MQIQCVLLPHSVLGRPPTDLAQAEFWGPFLVVLFYALVLVWGRAQALVYTVAIWLCGSYAVYFLSRSLGSDATLQGCLSLTGYSVLPIALCGLLNLAAPDRSVRTFLRAVSVAWAASSAGAMLAHPNLSGKRMLLLYPIVLLFVYFASLQHT